MRHVYKHVYQNRMPYRRIAILARDIVEANDKMVKLNVVYFRNSRIWEERFHLIYSCSIPELDLPSG